MGKSTHWTTPTRVIQYKNTSSPSRYARSCCPRCFPSSRIPGSTDFPSIPTSYPHLLCWTLFSILCFDYVAFTSLLRLSWLGLFLDLGIANAPRGCVFSPDLAFLALALKNPHVGFQPGLHNRAPKHAEPSGTSSWCSVSPF